MGIYQPIYDLVNTYIYGGTVAVGSYQELCCIAVSTIGCLFVMALPFIIVWRIIRIIAG